MKKKTIISLSIISVIGIALIVCAAVVMANLPYITNRMEYSKQRKEDLATITASPALKSINDLNDDELLKSANDAFVSESQDGLNYTAVLQYRVAEMNTNKLTDFIRDENNSESLRSGLVDMIFEYGTQSRSSNKKLIALLDEPVCDLVKEHIVTSADFSGKEDKLKQMISENSAVSDEALKKLHEQNPSEAYRLTADVFANAANYSEDTIWAAILVERDKLSAEGQTVSDSEKIQAVTVCVDILKSHGEKEGITLAAGELLSSLVSESKMQELLKE